jgi:hypothetical protein
MAEMLSKSYKGNYTRLSTKELILRDKVSIEEVRKILLSLAESPLKYIRHQEDDCHHYVQGKNFILLASTHFHARQVGIDLTVWGPNDDALATVEKAFADKICVGTIADVEWHFISEHGIHFEDIPLVLDDIVLDEAYPYIGGLDKYVENYATSKSPLLILFGPPGTGKTKLTRHILRIFAINNYKPKVMYTTCDKAMKEDEFYMRFLTHGFDFLVLEDIDEMLASRKGNDNTAMRRMLSSFDGFITNTAKIIMTTNLVITDIDEALLRPGRCHDVLKCRMLDADEARKLAKAIGATLDDDKKEYTVAEIYSIIKGGVRKKSCSEKIGFHKK